MSTKGDGQGMTERRLYEALRDTGGIIPQTVEEVERAQAWLARDNVQVPERLRDGREALARLHSLDAIDADTAAPPIFGHFVAMLRTNKGLSIKTLAKKAKVDEEEIRNIENDVNYEPRPRTVKQLADTFGIVPRSLARVANLTRQTDDRILDEAVKFAACGKNLDKLSRDDRRAIKEFVSLLNSLD